MVLCIDVENSDITLGGFRDSELAFIAKLSTAVSETEDEYAVKILNILALRGVDKDEIKGVIIASVVPQLNSVVIGAVKLLYGLEPIVVGPGVKSGINIHCDTPSSVGADLICASVAAYTVYGGPSLIVDMGTATKMIVVNAKGTFVGVSIVPGILMGLNALAEGAAQLPNVSLEAPGAVVAKNTVDCMKSGAVFGHASLIDGMIERINEEMGEELAVYATGKFASVVLPHCKHALKLDEHLVLKGLNIIYNLNVNRKIK